VPWDKVARCQARTSPPPLRDTTGPARNSGLYDGGRRGGKSQVADQAAADDPEEGDADPRQPTQTVAPDVRSEGEEVVAIESRSVTSGVTRLGPAYRSSEVDEVRTHPSGKERRRWLHGSRKVPTIASPTRSSQIARATRWTSSTGVQPASRKRTHACNSVRVDRHGERHWRTPPPHGCRPTSRAPSRRRRVSEQLGRVERPTR